MDIHVGNLGIASRLPSRTQVKVAVNLAYVCLRIYGNLPDYTDARFGTEAMGATIVLWVIPRYCVVRLHGDDRTLHGERNHPYSSN